MNLNALKVFTSVYKFRCMTSAASELHLTQSGVSQHIKSLEDSLGISLFDRIHRRLVPTAQGERLFQVLNPALFAIEEAMIDVKEAPGKFSGLVRIGMPVEFGVNRVIPLLADFGRQHPNINFNIELDFASTMNQQLLNGHLDFAFVDDFAMDKRVSTQTVTSEVFFMCCSERYAKEHVKEKAKQDRSFFESLDFVAYQEGEHALRSWFHHHLKRKNMELRVRARVMDVQGVSQFIAADLGVGILPDHKFERMVQDGYKLHVFPGSPKPLRNKISLAYLTERQRPLHVKSVLEYLEKQLRSLQ